jgi:hypothetical protein
MQECDQADQLHRALATHLPKLDGAQHGLIHRLHIVTGDFAIKAVLIVHNEPATGVTSDVAAVRRAQI